MDSSVWLPILRQKSTIAGIVSIVVAVVALFGLDLTAEHTTQITGVLVALLSLVAIFVQPKPAGGHYTPQDHKIGDTYDFPDGKRVTFDGQEWK